MKTDFVRDLKENDRILSFFLVQAKEVRFKKASGEPFLSLTLSDKSGQIEAKMWEGVEDVAETFERDDFVKVKANIQLFRDRPQMVINKLRRAEDAEVEIADYIPHTERDIDEMIVELNGAVNGFTNPHLKQLLRSFLDDEEIGPKLRIAPAAKSLHHATVGGLLEHVLSLMNLARLVASNYEQLDADLLQTGVVLHDIGKLDELTYGRSFGYSHEGQLLGHITMGICWIDRKCSQIEEFPPRLKTLVQHMVLSHHGRYEFGSPKLPMFPEALALAYIDDLDSKLEAMRAAIAADPGSDPLWTRYNPSLERTVLSSAMYLGEEQAPPEEPPPPLPPPLPAKATTGSLFGDKLQEALDGSPALGDASVTEPRP